MNEIHATLQKLTRGIKSKEQAERILTDFLETHDADANWNLIDSILHYAKTNHIGRRSQKRFISIQNVILHYLRKKSLRSEDPMDLDMIGEYEYILQGAIRECIVQDIDTDLIFLPLFYHHPTTLIALHSMNVTTLKELVACEQEVLVEAFRSHGEAIEDIVLFFNAVGVNLNVPRG